VEDETNSLVYIPKQRLGLLPDSYPKLTYPKLFYPKSSCPKFSSPRGIISNRLRDVVSGSELAFERIAIRE
jgi:hypothetical protein